MDLLIKSAKIVDPLSKHHGKKMDVLIENGILTSIKPQIPEQKCKTFKCPGLHLSPGWFDMHANFRDPGMEYQETLETGTESAMQGGFTGVALYPATHPPIDNKAGIDYIQSKTKKFLVDVFPFGTVSKGGSGKELSEMFDMHQAGALAFTDDKKSIQNANLLKIALQYAMGFNGLIINFPNDRTISRNGVVNEGKEGAETGLRGIPALAEELMVSRDLFLAGYCNSKIHISTISCGKSVDLIERAKKSGLAVSTEIASHQIFLDDTYIKIFDSNYKVLPPLRNADEIKALIKGIKNGVIDVICSDHSPEDEETKRKEFDDAAFGIIGLETCFAIANTVLRKIIPLEKIIEKICHNPRKILGLEIPEIIEGKKANFTLFNPDTEWIFSKNHIFSKSKNTPFEGVKLTGKALGVFNNGQWRECK